METTKNGEIQQLKNNFDCQSEISNYAIRMPKKVCNLTSAEKLTLLSLISFLGKKDNTDTFHCYPSQSAIAILACCEQREVGKRVKKFVSLGWLSVSKREKTNANIYTLVGLPYYTVDDTREETEAKKIKLYQSVKSNKQVRGSQDEPEQSTELRKSEIAESTEAVRSESRVSEEVSREQAEQQPSIIEPVSVPVDTEIPVFVLPKQPEKVEMRTDETKPKNVIETLSSFSALTLGVLDQKPEEKQEEHEKSLASKYKCIGAVIEGEEEEEGYWDANGNWQVKVVVREWTEADEAALWAEQEDDGYEDEEDIQPEPEIDPWEAIRQRAAADKAKRQAATSSRDAQKAWAEANPDTTDWAQAAQRRFTKSSNYKPKATTQTTTQSTGSFSHGLFH